MKYKRGQIYFSRPSRHCEPFASRHFKPKEKNLNSAQAKLQVAISLASLDCFVAKHHVTTEGKRLLGTFAPHSAGGVPVMIKEYGI